MKPVIDLAHLLMILQRENEHKLSVSDAVQLYRIDPELSEETLKNAAAILKRAIPPMMQEKSHIAGNDMTLEK